MSVTPVDLALKALLGKLATSSDKAIFEEFGAETINVAAQEIWEDTPLPANPADAVAAGTAELRTLFTFTEDSTVADSEAWITRVTPGDEGSDRLADWIPPDKFGVNYVTNIFDNNNVLITQASQIAVNMLFDSKTGILTMDDSSSFVTPFKITAHRYIGAKGAGFDGDLAGNVLTDSVDNIVNIDKVTEIEVSDPGAVVAFADNALHLKRAGQCRLQISTSNDGVSVISFSRPSSNSVGTIVYAHDADRLEFRVANEQIFEIEPGGFEILGTNNTFRWANATILDGNTNGFLKLTNSAGTDFSAIQLGGTTSGFPALFRSAARAQIRLADDSGFAGLDAGDIIIKGTDPGAVSPLAGTLLELRSTGTSRVTFSSDNTGAAVIQFGDVDNDNAGSIAYLHQTDTIIFFVQGATRVSVKTTGLEVAGTALISAGFAAFGAAAPGSQPAKISDPSGGGTVDAESRTAINAIIDVLEGAGLAASA